MSFPDQLKAAASGVEAFIAATLDRRAELPVVQAMRYAMRGGKGLRGYLALESARLHGIPTAAALPAAASVEALHAYSLIHDDLPAMDDDDLRRGQPTIHVKWDEATAILAGDALQTLAFELLADPALGAADRRIALVASLAKASGAEGMVLGQALDIAAETAPQPLDLAGITRLQAGKTGALICHAATIGPHLAGADPAPLLAYAQALGLAFQIHDDILDVTGDADTTGKRTGKDAGRGKATFVSLLGLEGAQTRAKELISSAEAALTPYGAAAENLVAAARFTISRQA
ncbi:polyprenyl synthetase family protein [Pseudogemmobacter hezensis]|uniref:polyprenyl synthetase family protein n=1 Tax=Pseudogemmobacter hezensis TaxID=2737662 RepID=UPI003F53D896